MDSDVSGSVYVFSAHTLSSEVSITALSGFPQMNMCHDPSPLPYKVNWNARSVEESLHKSQAAKGNLQAL